MAYNSKYTGEEVENLLTQIPEIERRVNTHNKKLEFFAIEPVTVIVGGIEHHCEANQVATVFVGDEEFEIIPTSNNSIQSLVGYPIPLTWYDWLEGVDVFENIVFDMNELDTYKHWIQYYQDEYHVQKAQYSNCIFWSDKPYTHSPFEERTNYTLYYTAELPLCYSRIPENTYKPFYLAYGVKTDPNWNNPDYVNSYSLVSGATQTFSYYGATAIGIFDMGVDIIKLPKDCRGLMYHAPAITHAGVFDAVNTTNFGAKKGSWQEAFVDRISLVSLYIKNLKKSINISWSPINNESIEFILNNAANTSAITISVSPYTWYRLTDSIRELAKSKNITLELISTNYPDDVRWESKQDTISDLDEIRSGASKGATAVQPDDIPNSAEPMVCAYRITSYTANHIELDNYTYNGQTMDYREGAIILITNTLREDVVFEGGTLTLDGNEYETDAFTLKVGATILFSLGVDPGFLYEISSVGGDTSNNNKLPLEDTAITLEGNVLSGNVYVIPNAISSLSVDIIEPTDGVLVKDYIIHFFTGASVSSFSFPDELLWANGNAPTIEESTAYELSVVATSMGGGYVYKGVLTVFK